MPEPIPLPVDAILPDLLSALATHNCALICAPPGSGKTTRVPPALLDGLGGGRILLLQPRRMAARASARRIAFERGCEVGAEVGYRVRFENRTGADTRIEVLTEGLLTRQLQSDPFLEGVAAVVLDEFHERSLHSDLALALLREVQHEARPDLKLVVMSATLDAAPAQDYLGGPDQCPLLQAAGRTFEIEVAYQSTSTERPLEESVAAAVYRVVEEDPEGHVLVFLPGVAEIERTAGQLRQGLPPSTRVLPLHGSLKSSEQDAVLRPTPYPKVVLATNIAETSLTLEGVTSVVDSGWVRRPRFDPRLGLDRLETVTHSQASATQRAGRAGRTRPGRCVRLWSSQAHALRPAHELSEVSRTDLASTVLQLYAWGTRPQDFHWFEAPADSAIETAEGLLLRLGALDEGSPRTLTPLGTQLAQLPVHPRLGRVLVAGCALGVLEWAAGAAALASERDPWRQVEGTSSDLLLRLEWLSLEARTGADRRALQRVRKVRDQLVRLGRRLAVDPVPSDLEPEARVVDALIAGFPDRVGLRRVSGERRLLLSGGQGADLAPGLRCGDCMVAVSMTAGPRGRTPWVRVTAEIDPNRLPSTWVDEAIFDRESQSVRERQARRFGALVLESRPLPHGSNPERVAAVLCEAAQGAMDTVFSFSAEDGRLLRRLRFAQSIRPDGDWPDWLNDPAVLLPEWCQGKRSFEQLMQMELSAEFRSRLTWEQQKALDTWAPDRMEVPSGSTVRIAYPEGRPPVLAARIQQLFGMKESPKLGGVALTVHLLAPNGRPAQITQDLAGFWAGSYAAVRKDLRGRYPRHAWPEDPSQAVAEDRPKRRR